VKLNPEGNGYVYSTYLGMEAAEFATNAIAVDSDGEAYVAGSTLGAISGFKGGFQSKPGGGTDGFVVKFNASGTKLIWSTYLGGSGNDWMGGIALDRYRNVYVTGYTASPDFPQKASVQSYIGPPYGVQRYVSTLSGNLGSIVYYSTYFGGGGNFYGYGGIAVDAALNAYVTGVTYGEVSPTPGAVSITPSSRVHGDVYISKLVITDDLVLGLSAAPSLVAHGGNLTYTIAVTSKGPDFGSNVRVADKLPAGTKFVSLNAGGGACIAPAVGGTGTINCTLPQLNEGATWNVKLTVNVTAASGTNLSNSAATTSNMQDFVPANNSETLTVHMN
jgi:uncharacterized repeat protein (TIGR01451 family)